jgi:chorismate mutase
MKDSNSLVIDGHLNYYTLINKFKWLTEEGQKTIISPDVDGILCGLFMSFYYNWEVVGFYDGKQLAIKQDVNPTECIFLDMEIYRQEIRSCGHHIVLYNKRNIPPSWNNFSNCINPNIIREYDAYNDFQQKYPLAMIHFIICVISSQKKITLPKSAISPLLYVDGTFKNLLNYPENCINWLNFFNAKDPRSPIYPIYILFANRKIADMIHELEIIFKKFKKISEGKRGGDKIKISDISNNSFSDDSIKKIERLINLLANYPKWEYKPEKWILRGLNILNFSKKIKENLNNRNYTEIINHTPLSFAITATKRMEYTLEK